MLDPAYIIILPIMDPFFTQYSPYWSPIVHNNYTLPYWTQLVYNIGKQALHMFPECSGQIGQYLKNATFWKILTILYRLIKLVHNTPQAGPSLYTIYSIGWSSLYLILPRLVPACIQDTPCWSQVGHNSPQADPTSKAGPSLYTILPRLVQACTQYSLVWSSLYTVIPRLVPACTHKSPGWSQLVDNTPEAGSSL